MTLTQLVLHNMTRRRVRFALTVGGITVGIAACVTFLLLGGSLKDEVARESAALGANLVVTPKGSCAYEQVSILTGEQLPSNITMEEVAAIRSVGGIRAVAVLTERSAIANRPLAVSGVEPAAMKHFKGWEVAAGSYFAGEDDHGVVLGAALAESFRLAPGANVVLRGVAVPVRGVLAPTDSKDDLTLFLPLRTAQRLYNSGDHVSFVALKVDDLNRIDAVIEEIRGKVSLGVVSDRQMLKSVLSIVGTVNLTLQLIAAVSVLAAAFGIVNTMLTATYERRREIGILQALGAPRATIFTLFVVEAGGYGLLGGIGGVTVGTLFTAVAAPYLENNAVTAFVKGSGGVHLPDLSMVLLVLSLATLLAVLSGLYPAWRAARLTPVEAISHE